MDLAAAAAPAVAVPGSAAGLRQCRRRRSSGLRVSAAAVSPPPLAASTAVAPVYAPTPRDRPLRTPHSGYHFDGAARPFFEGWYFKVSIPECRQSFCFIYSVENPSFRDGMSVLDSTIYGPRFTGVGAQILGADDKYICQFSEKSRNFWGSRHELMLGNTFVPTKDSPPSDGEVPPQEFCNRVLEGFQVTPIWHQGFIRDDGRSKYVQNVQTACWEYSTHPVYGWGDVKSKQKSTAGWLAAFPVFEPHWQVCMAGGLSTGFGYVSHRVQGVGSPSKSRVSYSGAGDSWQACIPGGILGYWMIRYPYYAGTIMPRKLVYFKLIHENGWIEWDGERFEFENAPSYSEKNWGGGFPRKWYWVQCNVFEGASGEVSLTAAGGLRKLGLGETYENPALIGVHYEGKFYEFVPWTGTVSWEIAPWGHWKMSAENEKHLVELEATTEEPGAPLRAPTMEAGLVTACRDTCYGDLKLQLWEKRFDGGKGKMILDATSNMAALEVGGGPWFSEWKGKTASNELVNGMLRTPVDVESFFPIPILKPPGL